MRREVAGPSIGRDAQPACGDRNRWSFDTAALTDAEANRVLADFEYATGRQRLDSVPRQLHLALSEHCNMRCIMCRVRVDSDEFVSRVPARVHSEVEALLPLTETVNITGAEPFHQFASSPAKRLIDAARPPDGPFFVATTNGALLAGDICDVVLDRFSSIRISIDSPYSDVYESIRVRSSFDRVRRNVEHLRDLKVSAGRGREDHPEVHINYLIMDRTFRGIVDFIELANTWQVSGVRFSPLRVNFDEALASENIFTDVYKVIELADLMTEARRRASNYGIGIIDRTARLVRAALNGYELLPEATRQPNDDRRRQRMPVCPAPWNNLWIARNGEARFCRQGATIGEVGTSSLHEVYNGNVAQSIRRQFVAGDYTSCKRGQCPRDISCVGTNRGAIPDDFEAQRVDILQRSAYSKAAWLH